MQIRSPVASTSPLGFSPHRTCLLLRTTGLDPRMYAMPRLQQATAVQSMTPTTWFQRCERENQNITLEQQLPHLISRAMESNWLQKHKIQHLKNEVERAIPNWLLFARNWYTRCIWLIFIISILSSFSTSQLCDIAQGRCCVFCDIISNYCLRAAERFWVFQVCSKKTFAPNAGE